MNFQPLYLENGMTELHLLYSGWEPGGSNLTWEIRPSGLTEWTPIADIDPHPLNGLPATVELRAVFQATTDLAPMIEMDQFAQTRTGRHRSDMVAVSDEIHFGLASDSIQTEIVVDAYDASYHSHNPQLITTGSPINADVTTAKVDPSNSRKFRILSTYSLPAPVSNARIRFGMNTNNVVKIPFVEDAALYAL